MIDKLIRFSRAKCACFMAFEDKFQISKISRILEQMGGLVSTLPDLIPFDAFDESHPQNLLHQQPL